MKRCLLFMEFIIRATLKNCCVSIFFYFFLYRLSKVVTILDCVKWVFPQNTGCIFFRNEEQKFSSDFNHT